METERLIIRRFQSDDWQDLYEYLSQEATVAFEPYGVCTIEESKEEAIRRAASDDFWAVCLKQTGKLIGNLYLSKRDFNTWSLGYVFNADFLHKGYATESAHALVNHVFTTQNAHRVTTLCNPKNKPSWQLMERLGMRREATLLQNVYFDTDIEGKPIWLDTYEYAILSSEWQQ